MAFIHKYLVIVAVKNKQQINNNNKRLLEFIPIMTSTEHTIDQP